MAQTDANAYGIMAHFASAGALEAATRRAHEAGYRDLEAFAPVPLPALETALELTENRIPRVALAAGLVGAVLAYGLQYYAAVHGYPFVVGGKPLHSWPAFLLVTFEVAILSAVLATVISMLALGRYPMPYHPVFNAEGFERVTSDGYVLCIRATDRNYDAQSAHAFLKGVDALSVMEVPH